MGKKPMLQLKSPTPFKYTMLNGKIGISEHVIEEFVCSVFVTMKIRH